MTPADLTGSTLTRSTDAAHAATDTSDNTETETVLVVVTCSAMCYFVVTTTTWGQISIIDFQTRPVVGNTLTQ